MQQYVNQEGYSVPWSRFTAKEWSMESPAVEELLKKVYEAGIALKDFAGSSLVYGVKTGLNSVYVINQETKDKLIREDHKSSEIIKRCCRGQDVKRWFPDLEDNWLIFSRRGIDLDLYPAIKSYLTLHRDSLEPCPKTWDVKRNGKWKGRKTGSYQWYELQDTVDYWKVFEKGKIIYTDIAVLIRMRYSSSPL